LDIEPLGIKPHVFHDPFAEEYHIERMVVAMSNVIAFTKTATADEHPIHSVLEGPENECRVDSPGAHDADHPYFGCILQPGHASQIGSAIRSPMAYEAQDPGFEVKSCTHYDILSRLVLPALLVNGLR